MNGLARSAALCLLALAAAAALEGYWSAVPGRTPIAGQSLVRGRVASDGLPIAGATVRAKGRAEAVRTDVQGEFLLRFSGAPWPLRVTASHPDYLIAGTDYGGQGWLRIEVQPRSGVDDADYAWVDPRPDPAREGACGNCHAEIHQEWSTSAHARSFVNPRFRDVHGSDGGEQEYPGWDLATDYPEGQGVCYSCHTPSPEPDAATIASLEANDDVHAQGIHCDFCHKVAAVQVEPPGLNHGRFALTLERPPPGEQLFFGPLDDVDRGEDVALPLYKDSRYCAPCHEGILFGTHAYSTYSEWLASPAADRLVQCQDCHMAPTGRMTNIAPGHGGIERGPETLAQHRMPGSDPDFVRAHVGLELDVRMDGQRVLVHARVRATDVGHRVPTGHPSRHLLLWIEARDATGDCLRLIAGPHLPEWAGRGAIGAGNLAGQPGVAYAKVLAGLDGQEQVAYWRPNQVARDTRLWPERTDRQRFVFELEGRRAPASITARLIYRRFPKPLADAEHWPDNEFVVAIESWGASLVPAPGSMAERE